MNSVEDSVVEPDVSEDTLEFQDMTAISFCPVNTGTRDHSSLTITMTNAAFPHVPERWYDPITGRWLSNDPIGISGGLNQYVFCGNNPVNFRDPLGLCGTDHSQEEVEQQMRNLALEYDLLKTFSPLKGLSAMLAGFAHHTWPFPGDLAYKASAPDDTWKVPGWNANNGRMWADEYGNYLAGFSGEYIGGGSYYVVRLGGMGYATSPFVDNGESWRDEHSIPYLEAGGIAAQKMKQARGQEFKKLPLLYQMILQTFPIM